MKTITIADFDEQEAMQGWRIEDDGVMGGVSQGKIAWNEDGYALFSGDVSLENNGGFSSVLYGFEPINVSGYTSAVLRVKGDGKAYRFLVEAETGSRHYYMYPFETSGDWETIRIPLADMVPMFRGDRLSIPNFPVETLALVRLFIGNGKEESFCLWVDKIELE